MVPLLAPLLGSLAGSLLPATVGTGIAGALGIGGTAAGGLIAAAAPKAIGAGIGTLLGGGDLGDAAINAVGFGAAGAASAGAAPAATSGAAQAAKAPLSTTAQVARAVAPMLNQPSQNQPAPPAPNLSMPANVPSAQSNAMLQSPQAPLSFGSSVPTTVAPVTNAMPAAVGIGALPFNMGQPMASTNMTAGLSQGQQNAANPFLVGRGMRGFV